MFDWRTGDDREWLEQPSFPPPKKGWVQRRLPTAVFLILILLVGGVYGWLRQRADVAAAATEQAVLHTHQLLQNAVLDGDNELFTALLYPEEEWALLQQELAADGLFFDRAGLGLWLNALPDTPPLVTLSPDLRHAELVTPLPYFTQNGEIVMLLQSTAVYQHNGHNWQFYPPDEQFWGEWQEMENGRVTLRYRQRDDAVIHKFAPDFAGLIVDLCTVARCPADLQLHLTFSDDARDLLPFGRHYRAMERLDEGLILPSPTLVGLPVDGTGYAALRDGYSGWITAVLLHEFEQTDPPSRPHDPAVTLEELGLALPSITRRPAVPLPQPIVMQCGSDLWAYDRGWTAVLEDTEGVLQTTTTGDLFYASSTAAGAILYAWDDGFTPVVSDWQRLTLLPADRYPQFGGRWVRGGEWQASAARLFWSGNGRYTLMVLDGAVWLGDADGRPLQVIEDGHAPFWIDTVSYGYLRPNGDVIRLMLADSVLPEQSEPAITPALLADVLPEETAVEIEGVTVVAPDRWLVRSSAGVFVFNPQTAVVEAVVLVEGETAVGGKRFLAHHADGIVQIYDLQEGEVERYTTVQTENVSLTWSADNRWLLVADAGIVRLIGVETGEQVVIEHGMTGCETAVFVEEGRGD